jgi:hypothetical protein
LRGPAGRSAEQPAVLRRARIERRRPYCAVRASFKLSELLPVDDSIEHERESLSAPSVKLMRTVAAAIKEDLSKVKDVLDIFVRRGGGRSDELAPQLELLKKISDTLGVLGLGELRQRVQEEIAELSEHRGRRQDTTRRVADQGGRRAAVGRRQPRRSAGAPDPAHRSRCKAHRFAGRSGSGVQAGQRGGAARMHRQPGAHQGGRYRRRAEARRICAAGSRQCAAAVARHHRRIC